MKNLVVLRGGMSVNDRKTADKALNVSDDDERLILATGRYIGEGFDDSRLDTLFLTMPIAWKGTLGSMSAGCIANMTEKGMSWSWTMSTRLSRFSPGWPQNGVLVIAHLAT